MPTATCHHRHASGNPCGSFAMRGEQFCFHHHPTAKPLSRRARALAHHPFAMPPIYEPADLHVALGEILTRVAANTLDTRRAGILLQALQITASNMRS
jgi:hypothetical protein